VSQWLNLLIEIGFRSERVEEPRSIDETVRARPDPLDAQVVDCLLHIQARKLLRATLQMCERLRVLFTGRISGVEG